ncbi:unnamed protein product [Cylicocyclus nassatus]|uniref:Uncharacterized protein n=1 Tax=Cylicocyclus nassatus TaxID=53992 RepID=A0AA36H408_CYLNA|nr:unnamed protein product [Cylicocyclus nassatus]
MLAYFLEGRKDLEGLVESNPPVVNAHHPTIMTTNRYQTKWVAGFIGAAESQGISNVWTNHDYTRSKENRKMQQKNTRKP